MKFLIFSLLVFVISTAVPKAQQTQGQQLAASVSAAQQNAPKLTPAERQKFAGARDLVMRDAEYNAAVQKVQEAQKAADKLFFVKLRKAAPDLGEYIRYLENARGLTKPAQP